MKTIQESAADLQEHLRRINDGLFINVAESNNKLFVFYCGYNVDSPAIYDGYQVILEQTKL